MQKKGKSKNIATVVKPVEEPTLDLTSVNLNKVDVEALVKEEERLRDLIMKNLQSDQTVDGDKLENLSTVLLQALHTKDEQLINYALEKDVKPEFSLGLKTYRQHCQESPNLKGSDLFALFSTKHAEKAIYEARPSQMASKSDDTSPDCPSWSGPTACLEITQGCSKLRNRTYWRASST